METLPVPEWLKKIGRSALRIGIALAVLLGVPALCYLIWQPGEDTTFPAFPDNAIWIGHGWLGDDGWFDRNGRNRGDFRSGEKISALFRKLADNRISVVHPHLCPARKDGRIAPCDSAQTERFLTLAEQYGIRVVPWVGGVLFDSARPDDRRWRQKFISSIGELLEKHPKLAGVQVNIEPLPDGDRDFLRLLEELRPRMRGKILGVAAYPPPTRWQENPHVHWQERYLREVAGRCDQLTVMMYDTAIPLAKFYTKLMTDWTESLTGIVRSGKCRLVLGIPAYEDPGVGYHRAGAENIISALRGISAARRNGEISGIALYCEWEMTEAKWRQWRGFIRRTGAEK